MTDKINDGIFYLFRGVTTGTQLHTSMPTNDSEGHPAVEIGRGDAIVRLAFGINESADKQLDAVRRFADAMVVLTDEFERKFCTSDDPANHQGATCPVHESNYDREAVLAKRASHMEPCNYTVKATSVEVENHLRKLAYGPFELRRAERALCWPDDPDKVLEKVNESWSVE